MKKHVRYIVTWAGTHVDDALVEEDRFFEIREGAHEYAKSILETEGDYEGYMVVHQVEVSPVCSVRLERKMIVEDWKDE